MSFKNKGKNTFSDIPKLKECITSRPTCNILKGTPSGKKKMEIWIHTKERKAKNGKYMDKCKQFFLKV